MKSNEYVLDRIKFHISEQGTSYQLLSEEIGVSKSLIGHMLSGKRVMKPERLVAIAKALNVEVEELIKPLESKNGPLEIKIRGELTSRKSNRTFDYALFAIEDYITMKNYPC